MYAVLLCIFFAFVALHQGGGAHIVFSFSGRDVTAEDKGCKNRDVIRSLSLSFVRASLTQVGDRGALNVRVQIRVLLRGGQFDRSS